MPQSCSCFRGRPQKLKRGKSQGSETTIQQSFVDVYVVGKQFLKDTPKVGQIAPVEGFKQTYAAQNSEAFATLRAL